MAKEVDLSSREWCDLVFEGKNKDFGAYVIRTDSPKRHNLAVLWALIGAVAVAALSFGLVKANRYLEERRLAGLQDQKTYIVDFTPEAEEQQADVEDAGILNEVMRVVALVNSHGNPQGVAGDLNHRVHDAAVVDVVVVGSQDVKTVTYVE